MYYDNNNGTQKGNPYTVDDYYNYLTSRWKDGSHLAAPYTDTLMQVNWTDGTGPGAHVSYAYDGAPNSANGWTECLMGEYAGDRRIVIAASPVTFQPAETRKFAFALITTPRMYHNGCPSVNFDALYNVSDTAKDVYCNPLVHIVNSVPTVNSSTSKLLIYPNPAENLINVEMPSGEESGLFVLNQLGQKMAVDAIRDGNKWEINISKLPKGVYHVICTAMGVTATGVFIK